MRYRDRFVPAYDKPTRGVWRYDGRDEEFRPGEDWRDAYEHGLNMTDDRRRRTEPPTLWLSGDAGLGRSRRRAVSIVGSAVAALRRGIPTSSAAVRSTSDRTGRCFRGSRPRCDRGPGGAGRVGGAARALARRRISRPDAADRPRDRDRARMPRRLGARLRCGDLSPGPRRRHAIPGRTLPQRARRRRAAAALDHVGAAAAPVARRDHVPRLPLPRLGTPSAHRAAGDSW